ncbi:MAG: prepilin-type N-terminal cleavage/methylation domain-containing protein [Campylobacterota bacterium]
MVRSAFTLIELIFAIVIIAISVISLPMMSQTVSKGIDANLVQEAIFGAATKLNEAVAAHWDDNSLEPGKPNSFARVIDDGTCLNTPLAYRQMPGHINQPLHRRCLDSSATTPANTDVNADITSLDDMEVTDEEIFISGVSVGAQAYKDIYTSTVAVNINASFGLTANNPNMKSIVSTISDSSGVITVLRTYSANIGEVDYYKRSY